MPEPLTLNCRDAADAQQQRFFLRLTALAAALHDDHHPAYLTAAVRSPNATPRPPAGSALAADLQTLLTAQETRHWRHRRALSSGSVADVERASRALDAIERDIAALNAELAVLRTGRGHPCPNPNLYRVSTPPLELLIRGEVFEARVGETWQLDTHTLPQGLRDRLTTYLLGGDRAAPYWYCRSRRRLYATSRLHPDTLPLLTALAPHLTRALACV